MKNTSRLFLASLAWAAMIGLLHPQVVLADNTTWVGVFNQLPEDIQNRILDEASKARQDCSAGGMTSLHYDCNCVAEAFRQARTLQGPQPRYHELYKGAFEKRCIDREAITRLNYRECMQMNSVDLQDGAEPYCGCYADKTAERFFDKPYLSIDYRSLVHREVTKDCDRTRYLSAAIQARSARQKPATPAPAPTPSGPAASPWPWEWLSLRMPPDEIDRALLAAGLEVPFNKAPCFERKTCRREYQGALPGTQQTTIKMETRKGVITRLSMKISYPLSALPEAERRLGGSISNEMLKPAKGQLKEKVPYCNAKRTTCYNIPDPTTPAESQRRFYRHFELRRDRKTGKRAELYYRIMPVTYHLSELGLAP